MKDFVENYENLADVDLLSHIKEGKYECLQVLLNRYISTVDFYCAKYNLLNHREDILQEATFSLYSSINSYDETKSSFSTFASLIIKRVIIEFIKKNSRKKDIPQELFKPLDEVEIVDFNHPEKILIEKENYHNLTKTIELELSSFELDVLNLFLVGMSYNDIAKKLSISEKSVDNALARIRKKLK